MQQWLKQNGSRLSLEEFAAGSQLLLNHFGHPGQSDELAVHVLERRPCRRADIFENLHVAIGALGFKF